jgi:hypothetical protein
MRMRFIITCKNPVIPVQTFKAYKERTLVRYKSNSPPRYVFREKAAAHYRTLSEHPNPVMGLLTDQPKRRLKSSWTFDGIN